MSTDIIITKYADLLNQTLASEESKMNKILSECKILNIKYDLLIFEMPMYVEIEPPLRIPQHKYLGFFNPEEKMPKKGRRKNGLNPVTYYRVYQYVNTCTGNSVDVTVTSKIIYDYSDTPYYPLRVTFRSENSNVLYNDIRIVLDYISRFYEKRIQGIKNLQSSTKLREPLPYSYLDYYPFYISYAEPCIDISGTEKAISRLFNIFNRSFIIKQFTKQQEFKAIKTGKLEKNENQRLHVMEEHCLMIIPHGMFQGAPEPIEAKNLFLGSN